VSDANRYSETYEEQQRRRSLFLRAIRVVFLVLFLAVTFLSIFVVTEQSVESEIRRAISWQMTLGSAMLMALIVLAVDYFTPKKRDSTLFSVFVGLLGALLATVAIGFVIDVIVKSYDIKAADTLVATIKVLLGISLSYLGVTTVLQTQDDFRLVIPYVEFSKQMRGVRPLVLDTSILVDGRIADIAQTNFLLAPIVIPRFVIDELQTLADSADGIKRAKGRRGLDIVTRLQRAPRLDVTIEDSNIPGKAVDQMLVEFSKSHSALLVTVDHALAKVAKIHNIGLLNINDLANALKPALVPGERLVITLMRQGEQAGQAVGYLPDGTMVVAEDGASRIGEEVELVVTGALQTSAGRMIFARVEGQLPAGSASPVDVAPVAQAESESSEINETQADVVESDDRSGDGPHPPHPPKSIRRGTPRNPRR